MRIKQNTQMSDLSAERSTSQRHYSKRCTLTPNFLFDFKLCSVSRYLKNTSQQNLDTENLQIELP